MSLQKRVGLEHTFRDKGEKEGKEVGARAG